MASNSLSQLKLSSSLGGSIDDGIFEGVAIHPKPTTRALDRSEGAIMPFLPAKVFKEQAELRIESHLMNLSSNFGNAGAIGHFEVIVWPVLVDGLQCRDSLLHMFKILQEPLSAHKDQIKIQSKMYCLTLSSGQEGLNQHHAVLKSSFSPD